MTGYDGELLVGFEVDGQHRQYYSPDPEGTGSGTMTAEENVAWVPPNSTGSLTIHSSDDVDTGEVRAIDAGGEVHRTYPSYTGGYYLQYISMPSEPGIYRLDVGETTVARFDVRAVSGATDPSGQPDSVTEQRGVDDETDASDVPGLVPGDEGEMVLSPALRRQGYTAEGLGGEIEIGGETYQINPADTVVRDPETGEAVDRGPGGESGAPGEDPSQRRTDADRDSGGTGIEGATGALAVLAALAAGYMVMR